MHPAPWLVHRWWADAPRDHPGITTLPMGEAGLQLPAPRCPAHLPDDEFKELFGLPESAEVNKKLAAITLAFAALGKEMTGLPIDFQIQSQTWANEKYPNRRSALVQVRPEWSEPKKAA